MDIETVETEANTEEITTAAVPDEESLSRAKAIIGSGMEKQVKALQRAYGVPNEVSKGMMADFANYMREDDKFMDGLEKLEAETAEAIKQQDEEYRALVKEMNYGNIVAKLREMEAGVANPALKQYYHNLALEIESCYTMALLQDSIKNKVKVPSKIRENYQAGYAKELKKFRAKLAKEKKYLFGTPDKMNEQLKEVLAADRKDYSELFLYALFKFVNTRPDSTSKYAVFIGQTIASFARLNDPDFDIKSDIMGGINSTIDLLLHI